MTKLSRLPIFICFIIVNGWTIPEISIAKEKSEKPIFSFQSVVAYMNGHNHAGNYEVKNGIHSQNLSYIYGINPVTSAIAMLCALS